MCECVYLSEISFKISLAYIWLDISVGHFINPCWYSDPILKTIKTYIFLSVHRCQMISYWKQNSHPLPVPEMIPAGITGMKAHMLDCGQQCVKPKLSPFTFSQRAEGPNWGEMQSMWEKNSVRFDFHLVDCKPVGSLKPYGLLDFYITWFIALLLLFFVLHINGFLSSEMLQSSAFCCLSVILLRSQLWQMN